MSESIGNNFWVEKYGEYAIVRERNLYSNNHFYFYVSLTIRENVDGSELRTPLSIRKDFDKCDSFEEAERKLDKGYVAMIRLKKNNDIVYFVSNNPKGKTRDIKEARVFTLKDAGLFINAVSQTPLRCWIESNGYRVKKAFAIKYEIYKILENCQETQDWLDEMYPPSRKPISKKTRETVYGKCQGHCAYCGKEITLGEMQIDHIVPHSQANGKDDISNYLPACRDCNLAKGTDSLEEFRSAIKTDFYHVYKKRKKPQNWLSDRIAKAYGLDENPEKKIVFYFEKGGK